MSRRWAGVDPSLTCTGWAVVQEQNGGFIYVCSGTIKSKSGEPLPYRLWKIGQGLKDVFDTLEDGDGICMEKTAAFRGNRNTDRLLHCAQGVVLSTAYPHANTIRELHPMQWRKHLGSGKMDKEQVKQVVQVILGKSVVAHVSSLDEWEALGIAIAGSAMGGAS